MCTIRRKKNSSHTSVLSFTLPPLCLLVLCFGLRLRLSKEQSNRRGRRYERRGKEGRKEKNPYFWSFLFVSWEIFFLHRQLVWRQTPETAHTPSQPSPPNLLLVASHLLLSPPLFHHYGTTQHTLLFFSAFSFVCICMHVMSVFVFSASSTVVSFGSHFPVLWAALQILSLSAY